MSLRGRAEVAWRRRSAATREEETEAVVAGADLLDYAEARRMGVTHRQIMEALVYRDLASYLRLRREHHSHSSALVNAEWRD
jgi:hypothetical protein